MLHSSQNDFNDLQPAMDIRNAASRFLCRGFGELLLRFACSLGVAHATIQFGDRAEKRRVGRRSFPLLLSPTLAYVFHSDLFLQQLRLSHARKGSQHVLNTSLDAGTFCLGVQLGPRRVLQFIKFSVPFCRCRTQVSLKLRVYRRKAVSHIIQQRRRLGPWLVVRLRLRLRFRLRLRLRLRALHQQGQLLLDLGQGHLQPRLFRFDRINIAAQSHPRLIIVRQRSVGHRRRSRCTGICGKLCRRIGAARHHVLAARPDAPRSGLLPQFFCDDPHLGLERLACRSLSLQCRLDGCGSIGCLRWRPAGTRPRGHVELGVMEIHLAVAGCVLGPRFGAAHVRRSLFKGA